MRCTRHHTLTMSASTKSRQKQSRSTTRVFVSESSKTLHTHIYHINLKTPRKRISDDLTLAGMHSIDDRLGMAHKKLLGIYLKQKKQCEIKQHTRWRRHDTSTDLKLTYLYYCWLHPMLSSAHFSAMKELTQTGSRKSFCQLDLQNNCNFLLFNYQTLTTALGMQGFSAN